MALRIAALEAIPIGIPFRRPYRTATGRLERREMLIVRITAADGTTGWGDAVPMSLRGGPGLDAVRADLERVCAPVLTGTDLGSDPDRSAADVLDRCRQAGAGPQAVSAVDIALLDLRGRHDGVPAWRTLGAAAPTPVGCNATLGADPPAEAAAAAAAAVAAGFRCLKVKVGDGGGGARITAVREATATASIRLDANGAWSVDEAIARISELEPLGIELVEQPCATVAELAAVRDASAVPIVADESVSDGAEATAGYARGGFDAATLKLAKVGGPHAAIAIAAAVPAYLSSALDSVLGIAAAAHTVQAMPERGFATGLAHGLATSTLFADNVADDGPYSGPEIEAGAAPGLGVAVDEAAIERLRLR